MARFTKSQRLLTSRDFDSVLDGSGTKVVCSDFVLIASKQHPRRDSRLGLIVSSKVGNAVVRNRIKRSIRSVFRDELSKIPQLLCRDIVVIARPSLVDSKGRVKEKIQETLRRCSQRLAGKLETENPKQKLMIKG